MSHDEEVKIVKSALEYEVKIQDYKEQISDIENEQFDSIPEPPSEEKAVLEEYPHIDTGVSFNKWYLLLLILVPIGWLVLAYLLWDYKKKKDAAIETIKNTNEYKELCKAVDERNAAIQAVTDRDFVDRMAEYNDLLAEYNQKKDEWEKQRLEKLSTFKDELSRNENLADELYLQTVLIPLKYHSVYALSYIYNIIAYSQYTFKEAASDYEIHLNRRLEEEKYHQQLEVNCLLSQVNDSLADFHVDMQGMTSSITKGYKKLAKSQNVQTIMSGIQNHNRNKMLEKFIK